MEFIAFSFLQGVLAFLAPCAVALLPGYIVAFISKDSGDQVGVATRLFRGFKLTLLSILGILIVYALAGGMIILAGQILKDYMKWFTIGMGGVLIALGILMVMGKNVSLSLHMNNATLKTDSAEALVFGMAYAVGALGCLFPLFLIVATQAIAAPTAWEGSSYFLAYFAGMSGMMILTILLSTFARNLLMKYLRKILPHMERITGILLIMAGVYVIYYQMELI